MNLLRLNHKPQYKEYMLILTINIIFGLLLWAYRPVASIPSFTKVLGAYPRLLKEDMLLQELISSGKLYLHVIGIALLLSSVIAYSSIIPILKPISSLVSKFRAMSLIGLMMVFTVLTPNGYWLKVAIMCFCIVPWLVTSMCGVINSIPNEEYEYADTLRLTPWKTAWHVVVRGQLHNMIEAFRQVAIMGIVLLPVAERLSKADGGIGYLLSSLERFQTFDKIWAVQILIVLIAIGQDVAIREIRELLCPYAVMSEERK